MTQFSEESLAWLDKLEAINAAVQQDPNLTQTSFVDKFKISPAQASYLYSLKDCLDQTAIAQIRQAVNGDHPYILSFTSAKALSGLNGKVSDLHDSVHAALDVIFSRRLDTRHIKALVEWIISGKPAAEFDPKAKTDTKEDKTEEGTGDDLTDNPGKTNLDLKKIRQLLEKAEAERIQGNETTAQDNLIAYLRKVLGTSPSKNSQNASGSKKGFSENIMLDWLGDIKFIKHIQTKIKKGQPISKGEVAFLWFHKVGEITGHLVKLILKTFKPIFKILHWVWKLVIDILKEVGLYKYAKALFVFAALFTACWFVWEAFHYGVMRPVEMIWSKLHHERMVSEPTPVPPPVTGTSQPEVAKILSFANNAMVHLKSKPTPVPTPLIAYKPSVSFKTTDFDPKLLEQEIAAIPADSLIKDYVFQPDEGMPADLAVSRFQDLTDEDRYTMMIGSSKVKILSVFPSGTNFIITYKSTDLFGLFGNSSGTMNIFLEDIQYIHINEIDHFSKPGVQPDIHYQCTVVAKGAKNPLTLQCGSKDDLENLVSTLEYFIRHSRLGHDAQPEGMPYPAQGVKLNNDCVVSLLWAASPMDKAGVQLGEMVWGVDQNTDNPADLKKLEAALRALPSGPHTLYIVSHADFTKAQSDVSFNRARSLNPERHKVVLDVL